MHLLSPCSLKTVIKQIQIEFYSLKGKQTIATQEKQSNLRPSKTLPMPPRLGKCLGFFFFFLFAHIFKEKL